MIAFWCCSFRFKRAEGTFDATSFVISMNYILTAGALTVFAHFNYDKWCCCYYLRIHSDEMIIRLN